MKYLVKGTIGSFNFDVESNKLVFEIIFKNTIKISENDEDKEYAVAKESGNSMAKLLDIKYKYKFNFFNEISLIYNLYSQKHLCTFEFDENNVISKIEVLSEK